MVREAVGEALGDASGLRPDRARSRRLRLRCIDGWPTRPRRSCSATRPASTPSATAPRPSSSRPWRANGSSASTASRTRRSRSWRRALTTDTDGSFASSTTSVSVALASRRSTVAAPCADVPVVAVGDRGGRTRTRRRPAARTEVPSLGSARTEGPAREEHHVVVMVVLLALLLVVVVLLLRFFGPGGGGVAAGTMGHTAPMGPMVDWRPSRNVSGPTSDEPTGGPAPWERRLAFADDGRHRRRTTRRRPPAGCRRSPGRPCGRRSSSRTAARWRCRALPVAPR
jgi:hypothetical protein